ncbi:type I-E CRISPR-associated protein Cas6/Cse3/CasE [Chromobacterium alticapitis]|uniref:Type I-E CRISPR-associated protein Cas6/Cse3/CasE n=1 Tax=Chromobacterium alticapitis TaxID=2073169 RepID=A0A2S5DD72_9NEIS|nr:type I-E CRISPR-associated protein Cas6/Cse3/CasE [Chromobacterium alticapitis]POZ61050.1 type I-E CRISPR-associated protein Cas6/Cse3/CasE [Chromobacterium alticapitis]
MYLTQLKLDAKQAAARRDLANAYDMHRSLCRAFVVDEQTKPSRFLWRLERHDAEQGEAVVLVQSEQRGNWQPLGHLLDIACKPLPLETLVQTDKRYFFRLLANPTVTREGKRYGLQREEEQLAWLARQLEKSGSVVQHVQRGLSQQWRLRKPGCLITVQAVRFDGVLAVDDAQKLRLAMASGLGHAKAMGLGLLSLAPL